MGFVVLFTPVCRTFWDSTAETHTDSQVGRHLKAIAGVLLNEDSPAMHCATAPVALVLAAVRKQMAADRSHARAVDFGQTSAANAMTLACPSDAREMDL